MRRGQVGARIGQVLQHVEHGDGREAARRGTAPAPASPHTAGTRWPRQATAAASREKSRPTTRNPRSRIIPRNSPPPQPTSSSGPRARGLRRARCATKRTWSRSTSAAVGLFQTAGRAPVGREPVVFGIVVAQFLGRRLRIEPQQPALPAAHHGEFRVVVRYRRSVCRNSSAARSQPHTRQALMRFPSGSAGWPESAGAPRPARAGGCARSRRACATCAGPGAALPDRRARARAPCATCRASPGKCAVSPPPAPRLPRARPPARTAKKNGFSHSRLHGNSLQRQQQAVALDQFQAPRRPFPRVEPRWCRTTASRRIEAPPAGDARAQSQFGIVAIGEKVLVEAADAVQHLLAVHGRAAVRPEHFLFAVELPAVQRAAAAPAVLAVGEDQVARPCRCAAGLPRPAPCWPPCPPPARWAQARSSAASQPGSASASLLSRAMNSPRAAAIPWLLAAQKPRFSGLRITRAPNSRLRHFGRAVGRAVIHHDGFERHARSAAPSDARQARSNSFRFQLTITTEINRYASRSLARVSVFPPRRLFPVIL